ncbi:ABC transporter ATP-binding protein [Neorhizobium sp. P12A]|uniref:ABC transporter ATP-binding protein n=1 Tax=Neorhizobium sp. P12A TaxID=2268027 RepID=UPI0011EC2BC2|nr:ABC transporter ATP-binding protein [Neorhizobium sp. P12A]KAA0693362.1 ABC transporter ATP-binding protein [Neorhizobium sp. P12A]
MTPHPNSVLSVRDLSIEIAAKAEAITIVDDVSFDVEAGETVAIVGESGSGKSLLALSLLSLMPSPSVVLKRGSILLEGVDMAALPEAEKRGLRGDKISMIFQDPMSSLNPVVTIGRQIVEAIAAHQGRLSKSVMLQRAAELLTLVGVPAPRDCLSSFPHQMSGGMRQRVLIAMALANKPRIIVADEPTTALDVTVQAQVMDVLREVRGRTGAAVLLITHDMGLVAQNADRVLVFYAGRIVESGRVDAVFRQPRHPYTRSLLESIPHAGMTPDEELKAIDGEPPDFARLPFGCAFHPRCWLTRGRSLCSQTKPTLTEIAPSHASACHFAAALTTELFHPQEQAV